MKIQNLIKSLSVILAAIFIFSTLALAQQEGDRPETPTLDRNQAERPEDSYLARFHARSVVDTLMKQNLEKIYLINVIQSNFPDKGWGDDYDTVYNGYKEGMEFFYKRQIIDARVRLEENRKAISDLLRVIAEDYREETEQMLGGGAEKVLALHLDATTRTNPDKSNELHLNQARLRIGYGQLDDGVNAFVRHNYEAAIYHFRVAKSYAIRIHEHIPSTDQIVLPSDDAETIAEKQREVKEQYQVHKADNLNRIFHQQD